MSTDNITSIYQRWQDLTSWYKHAGEQDTFELSYLVMGLSGESGEAADCIKKLLRKHGDQAWELSTDAERLKFAHEVADNLWYIVRTCTFLGITIEELMLLNVVKLYERLHTRRESGLEEIEWPFVNFSYQEAKEEVERITTRIFEAGRME